VESEGNWLRKTAEGRINKTATIMALETEAAV
jgi:hypothetical protein